MSGNKRVLRVLVTNDDKQKVNITMPLGLARLARMGGVADRVAKEHGIDLDAIIRDIEDSPDGQLLDVVDEKTGDHVELSVEAR